MKLTRKQELYLIDLGLRSLLDSLIAPKPEREHKGRKWTKEQKAKFQSTMRKKWAEKKKET